MRFLLFVLMSLIYVLRVLLKNSTVLLKSLEVKGITEINVADTVKEIRKALLDADVSYKIAKQFTDEVKQKALGQDVLKAISPSQLMIKIVHDELVTLMGGQKSDLNLKGNPAVVLMAGLQGSGQNYLLGKTRHYVKTKYGRSPLLVACDVIDLPLSNS